MRILNLGSLNIDKTYTVDSFVRPGETKSAKSVYIAMGAKGLNQTVAIRKAGCEIWHAGRIGSNGAFIKDRLNEIGVHTELISQSELRTGEAIIQVDASGQNCIILDHSANYDFNEEYVKQVISSFGEDDLLILQNEINDVDKWVDIAYEAGMKIALNPSPIDDTIKRISLKKISYLILNEIEAKEITGKDDYDAMIDDLLCRNEDMVVVLTLGSEGCICVSDGKKFKFGIYDVKVVDTTSAGDTFLGYFIASIVNGKSIPDCIKIATKASALAVSRKGSCVSIPDMKEVLDFKG